VAIPREAVLDTHALLWWLTGERRRIGRAAQRFLERMDSGMAIAVITTMSLVEVGEAVQRGRIRLAEPFTDFVDRLERTPARYRVAPLSAAIVRRAHDLFSIPERADRLIAATAIDLALPLVTRDPEIAEVSRCDLLW
jgi:PIN domain nuclease of toxin-antitoxin system